MKPEDKIKLVDIILETINKFTDEKKTNQPKFIGTLTKSQGIKGFKLAEIGNPVFEFNDRYNIYLESLDGRNTVLVPYYKKDLGQCIDFTASYIMEYGTDEYIPLISDRAELHALKGFLNDRLRPYYPQKDIPFNQKVVFALDAIFMNIKETNNE